MPFPSSSQILRCRLGTTARLAKTKTQEIIREVLGHWLCTEEVYDTKVDVRSSSFGLFNCRREDIRE